MTTEWLDLDAPPALPGLFLRAALRRGVRGHALPELGIRCRVQVDPGHLQRYRQVCAMAESAYLPPVYPHVLAFPLQMKLLTDSRFPFPLLGLVHLENHIRVFRPLGGLGPFQTSVHTTNLQPHEKGAVFSLIVRLEDQLGLLWEGDSRILCRAVKLQGQPPERKEHEERALVPLAEWPVPENTGRRYARAAGDYNPIHLHALTAKLFGFPRAIAHGLWNKARSLNELNASLPTAGYEVQVRFQKPVLLPTTVALQASVTAPEGQFRLLGQSGVPHLTGAWRPLPDDLQQGSSLG